MNDKPITEEDKVREEYADIIDLPHHVSRRHPQMSKMARAAQFAPFAALTGYDAVIHESARLTDTKMILEEDDNERLNRIMSMLMDTVEEHPSITVSFFKPDNRKAGGAYVSVSGQLKRIDDYEQAIIMVDGTMIPLAHIIDIQY